MKINILGEFHMTVIEFCNLPANQQEEIAKFLNWQLIGFNSKLIFKLKKRRNTNIY